MRADLIETQHYNLRIDPAAPVVPEEKRDKKSGTGKRDRQPESLSKG
jgi:hypothetical protein